MRSAFSLCLNLAKCEKRVLAPAFLTADRTDFLDLGSPPKNTKELKGRWGLRDKESGRVGDLGGDFGSMANASGTGST